MQAKELLTDKIIYDAVEFQKNGEFWIHGRYENGLVAEVPSDKVRMIPKEVQIAEQLKDWKPIITYGDPIIDWTKQKFEVAKTLYPLCLQKDKIKEFEAFEDKSPEDIAIAYAGFFVDAYKNSMKN